MEVCVVILIAVTTATAQQIITDQSYSNLSSVPLFSTESVLPTNESIAVTRSQVDGTAVFLFAGDLSLDTPVRSGNGSACPYEQILANVTEYFNAVDYNMVNLESPFVSRELSEKTFVEAKGIHNMAWAEAVKALTTGGIKSVTLANNHLNDFGGAGVRYTEQILKGHGIEVAGVTAGSSPPYSDQIPIIKSFHGVKVGILAYCADTIGECLSYRSKFERGPALLYKETAEQDIKDLKKKVNIVVLYLHWGKEYMAIPGEEQRQLAVYLSSLGVHLIVGAHPHVLQGHEWIGDTLVHYSLGNFVFHPHFTMMKELTGKANKTIMHARQMEQAKYSRGPAGFTELLMVKFEGTGIKEAWYLPIQIKIAEDGCPYPKVKKRDMWMEICGPEDENCYMPRKSGPIIVDLGGGKEIRI